MLNDFAILHFENIEDAAAALQRLGGARAMLATAPSGDAMGPLVSGLGARGKLIVVGVPLEPMQLSAFPLVFGGRSIYGSLAGTAIETEDVLAFSVLENIRPMIETVPFERAAEALRSHDERQGTVPHGARDRVRGP
jgi:propanol-preferring alcohol dehydrogenase